MPEVGKKLQIILRREDVGGGVRQELTEGLITGLLGKRDK